MASQEALSESESVVPETNVKKKMALGQILILAMLCFSQFCLAACVSLQGPFYPREAEKKGVSATVYGMIFGSFELASISVAPLYSKLVVWATPRVLIINGLFVAGSCSVLFGFLDRSPPGAPFIGLSFACRIMEGFAAAAITTASYTALAREFPDRVATCFAMMETFFGLGLIFGPTLGGVLYQVQGFALPFHFMGSLLLLSTVVAYFRLPTTHVESKKTGDILKFLAHPAPILDAFSVITALSYIGLMTATLEPALRQFNLKPVVVGVIFVLGGLIYGLTSPLLGIICDKGANPKYLEITGYVLQCVSLILIGPAPFIPFEPKLWLIIVSLVIAGLGFSFKIVSAFISCLKDSLRRGFPDDITTHGMVSALFTTSISLGAFIGPSIGGFLWDKIGFRLATMVYLGIDLLFLSLLLVYALYRRRKNDSWGSGEEEKTPLMTSQT